MTVIAPTQGFELIQGLSGDLGLSTRQVWELLDIHPRTLLRRQESGTLEEVELLRAQMLGEVLRLATMAFHDTGKAKA